MKHKNLLPILFIILAVGVLILFWKNIKNLLKKKDLPDIKETAQTKTAASVKKENKKVAAKSNVPPAITGGFPLRQGSRGDYVKIVQNDVGVTADGIWGPKTTKAVVTKFHTATISEELFKEISDRQKSFYIHTSPDWWQLLPTG